MIIVDDVLLQARSKALKMLEKTAKSSQEINRALLQCGFSQTVVKTVVAELERAGLLGDQEFAAEFLYFRTKKLGMSKARLRQELQLKGVQTQYIEQALEELPENFELESARRLAAAKKKSLSKIETEQASKRLWSALARRGYPSSVIRQIIQEQYGVIQY